MEKHFVQRYQDGEITIEEFQRLNALQVIETEGYKILSPEALEYLKGILTAAAPPTPFDKKLADFLETIDASRDEIAKAFLATHGCRPEDVEQYTAPDPDNPMTLVWGLRLKKRPRMGVEVKRPTIGIDRASLLLDEIGDRLVKIAEVIAKDPPEDLKVPIQMMMRVTNAVAEFRERWFNFHEQTLQAIEEALPDSVEELGGSLPAAVATIAKRMDLAERDANKYQDELSHQADEKAERWANYQAGGTFGHVGDLSQVISDVDLYQEKIEALAKEWTGKVHQDLIQELLLYRDLLRSVCANLEPLRKKNPDGTIPRGDATLIGKINRIVQEWGTRGAGHAIATAVDSMSQIGDLISRFGKEILAQAGAQEKDDALSSNLQVSRATLDLLVKEWEPVVALCQANAEALKLAPGDSVCPRVLEVLQHWLEADKVRRRPRIPAWFWADLQKDPAGNITEDPRLLIRDILIRIIYIGHPAEAMMPDGHPDWVEIVQRINRFLHPKAGGGITEVDEMRRSLQSWSNLWGPVIALCQEKGNELGIEWGGSVAKRVLQILQEYADNPKTTTAAPTPKVCGLPSHEHWLVDGHDFTPSPTNAKTCGWTDTSAQDLATILCFNGGPHESPSVFGTCLRCGTKIAEPTIGGQE